MFFVFSFLLHFPQESAAAALWHQYQALTSPVSQLLCEQLHLVLEPTQAAKLRSVPLPSHLTSKEAFLLNLFSGRSQE